jgi:hypothetical protein
MLPAFSQFLSATMGPSVARVSKPRPTSSLKRQPTMVVPVLIATDWTMSVPVSTDWIRSSLEKPRPRTVSRSQSRIQSAGGSGCQSRCPPSIVFDLFRLRSKLPVRRQGEPASPSVSQTMSTQSPVVEMLMLYHRVNLGRTASWIPRDSGQTSLFSP